MKCWDSGRATSDFSPYATRAYSKIDKRRGALFFAVDEGCSNGDSKDSDFAAFYENDS